MPGGVAGERPVKVVPYADSEWPLLGLSTLRPEGLNSRVLELFGSALQA